MRLCYPAAKGTVPLCAPGMLPAPWTAIPPIPGICPVPMAAKLPFPRVFPHPMAPMPLVPGPEAGPWHAGAPMMEEMSEKLMPALEGAMPAIEGLMQIPALMMEYAEATGLLARWPELQAMLTPGREPDAVPRPADLPPKARPATEEK